MDFKILETLILTCQNELENTEGYPDALSALQDHLQEKMDNKELPEEQAALLNWVDLLIMDKRAADLYMEYWQLDERPNDADRAARPDLYKDQHIPDDSYAAGRQLSIRVSLGDMGYPDPQNVVYDNEGVPLIYFKNPNFHCTHYYESLTQTDEN